MIEGLALRQRSYSPGWRTPVKEKKSAVNDCGYNVSLSISPATEKVEVWRGSSFLWKHAFFRIGRDESCPMFSEFNTSVELEIESPKPPTPNLSANIAGNLASPEEFKEKAMVRHGANGTVRLSPISAHNTLLTVLFFSAVAVAIGYWIFFPPVASQALEKSGTQFASPIPVAPARSNQ